MDLDVLGGDVPLKDFVQRTRQVCGTATRRILDDPTGVNREKLFSVFETHTPLDQRGKAAEPVPFGGQVLIDEDAVGFITPAYLLPREQEDRDVVMEQTRALPERLGGRIQQASYGVST